MSYGVAMAYAEFIEPLVSEEMQRAVLVSSYPHLKKGKGREISKKLSKAARPKFDTDAPKSTEELYHNLLRKLGNGGR